MVDPHAGMHDDWVPIWRRVKVNRREVEDIWDDFEPTQRLYDSFHNEWDLMVLFDMDAETPDQDYIDDEDDDMLVDSAPPMDPTSSVAYLDEINMAPPSTAYSSVQVLSSEIAFIAPSNLFLWASLTLGLRSTNPRRPPIPFPNVVAFMGFFIKEADKTLDVYLDLQEFVSYICSNDLDNPRFSQLSDFHPEHPMKLEASTTGLYVTKVKLSRFSRDIQGGNNASMSIGYILTPKLEEEASLKPNWILVVLSATSVTQILRNGWGSSTMEALVRHLVRHGVEFHTLSPSLVLNPHRVVDVSPQLVGFTGLPSIPDIKEKRTVAHYEEYVTIREMVMQAPEAKAVYRMGGILWQLAMESTANFDDLINGIMDGPCEVGPSRGEYFFIEG